MLFSSGGGGGGGGQPGNRAYLLALLTHHASWATLHTTIDVLLGADCDRWGDGRPVTIRSVVGGRAVSVLRPRHNLVLTVMMSVVIQCCLLTYTSRPMPVARWSRGMILA